ncbi:hypothetical protein K501DRAFT_84073 [Backusella circina FSU 941]|nr:hypothetical protein K501DRAFT_84073 [Backusella circina FSU 941]
MNEQTPLLKDNKKGCCSAQKSCCSSKPDGPSCCSSNRKSFSSELTVGHDQDYCYLSEQKWQYKMIALTCAIFLAVGSHFAASTRSRPISEVKLRLASSVLRWGTTWEYEVL